MDALQILEKAAATDSPYRAELITAIAEIRKLRLQLEIVQNRLLRVMPQETATPVEDTSEIKALNLELDAASREWESKDQANYISQGWQDQSIVL